MEFFIQIINAIIFGVVEGITEWLPISSTAHLIIFEQWLGMNKYFGQPFVDLFIVVIQFGAIIAVILTFFKKLWPFSKSKNKEEKTATWFLILYTVIACIPAVVVGLLVDDFKDQYLSSILVIIITLVVFGILFIVVETIFKKKNIINTKELTNLTIQYALIIGLAQMLALIPGVSRSGVTIIAALLLGFSRTSAAEFSFILSIPMIIGASGYKLLKFFIRGEAKTIPNFGQGIAIIIIGTVVAFIVSFFTIKYFMKFIKSKSFTLFGYYRIGLATLLTILILTNVIPDAATLVNVNSVINTLNAVRLNSLIEK